MERIRNVRKQFGSISWNYYIHRMDAEWYNSKSEDDDIFKVDLSIGATKPLIPGYVARGISNLKTDAMKESIAQCMKNQGQMDEARLEASYQRALRVLEDTVVAVPDELEAEEDLGPVQDEDAAEIVNEELFFEIKVNQDLHFFKYA